MSLLGIAVAALALMAQQPEKPVFHIDPSAKLKFNVCVSPVAAFGVKTKLSNADRIAVLLADNELWKRYAMKLSLTLDRRYQEEYEYQQHVVGDLWRDLMEKYGVGPGASMDGGFEFITPMGDCLKYEERQSDWQGK